MPEAAPETDVSLPAEHVAWTSPMQGTSFCPTTFFRCNEKAPCDEGGTPCPTPLSPALARGSELCRSGPALAVGSQGFPRCGSDTASLSRDGLPRAATGRELKRRWVSAAPIHSVGACSPHVCKPLVDTAGKNILN